jgi:hypothetical protein
MTDAIFMSRSRVQIGRSKLNSGAVSSGLMFRVDAPLHGFGRPWFSIQMNSGLEFWLLNLGLIGGSNLLQKRNTYGIASWNTCTCNVNFVHMDDKDCVIENIHVTDHMICPNGGKQHFKHGQISSSNRYQDYGLQKRKLFRALNICATNKRSRTCPNGGTRDPARARPSSWGGGVMCGTHI